MTRMLAILGTQRSGSTAIGRIAAQIPGFTYVGEIFHGVRGPHDDPRYEHYLTRPEYNFFTFKEDLVRRFPQLVYPSDFNQCNLWTLYVERMATLSGNDTLVFDVKYNSLHHLNAVWQEHFHLPHLLKLLMERKTPIIHIIRKGVFEQAVSHLRALQDGTWHARVGASAPSDAPIYLSPHNLHDIMFHNERMTSQVRDWLRIYESSVELTYEDLFVQGTLTEAAKQILAKSFGCDWGAIVPPDIVKMSRRPLRESIANAAEVLAYFEATDFAPAVRYHLSAEPEEAAIGKPETSDG